MYIHETINHFINLWPCVDGKRITVTEVVSGGAKGIDLNGETWATKNNIAIKRFPAQWTLYGRRAGALRNLQMAQYADGLLSIWDGKSRGSKHMIEAAEQCGIPRWEFIRRDHETV
jgi:hypothetical protein